MVLRAQKFLGGAVKNSININHFLEEYAKDDCRKKWEFLTSMEPKKAKTMMDDYEKAFEEESKRWDLATIDNVFSNQYSEKQ